MVSIKRLYWCALLCALQSACTAFPAEVTMSGNVTPPAALGGLSSSGSGTAGDPYTYTFTTTNGLSMAGYKFDSANASTKYMRLMMNGGSISGTRSAVNFTLNSVNSSGFASGLTVEQASTVDMGTVQTHADTANSSAGAVAIGTNTALGYIGDIRIAGISAYAESQCYDGAAGDVTIISTGSVNIVNSSDVPVGISAYGKGVANSGLRLGGNISIRHNGSLTVSDLNSYRNYSAAGAHRGGAGSVYVRGDYLGAGASGAFAARNIDTHTSSSDESAGSITVTGYTAIAVSSLISYKNNSYTFGNAAAGAINLYASGSITVGGNIDSSAGSAVVSGGGGSAGAVTIYSQSGSVTITGTVNTASTDDDHGAGNLSITAYGPVTLKNSVDLHGISSAYSGSLTLASTGSISIGTIDMSKLKYASFAAASNCVVTGAVVRFATNGAVAGNGAISTTQTALRLPAGQTLFYDASLATNASLAGKVYQLADSAGSAGQGGLLMPSLAIANTGNAVNVTGASATLAGYVWSTGSAPSSVFLYWGTSTAAMNQVAALGVCSTGSVLHTATGLQPDTCYYYQYAISNQDSSARSPVIGSFITLPDKNQFSRKMQISFPGYSKAETLTNFPALVVLSNNSSFTYAQFASTNGWDLRFMDEQDSSTLNYEIESWSTSGASYVWVQVPAFTGGCSIWARWGNAAAAAAPQNYTTNGSVWGGNYKGVWHLGGTASLSANDSSANFNHGTLMSSPVLTNAIAGGGAKFNSTNQYIAVPAAVDLAGQSAGSISTWFRCDGPSSTAAVSFIYYNSTTNPGYTRYGLRIETNRYITVASRDNDSGQASQITNTTPVVYGDWNHFYTTVDAATDRLLLYQNGRLVSSNTVAKGSFTSGAAADSLAIAGFTAPAGYRYVNGVVDEMRVGTYADSSNWVWAVWQNMASNSTFNTLGQVQTVSRGGTIYFIH